jgi:RTX calcium-binding nonapeptide repeat (4 copies)
VIHGDAGPNVLDGGAGHDLLNGGRGNDVMTGGAGDDRFFFANTSSSGNPADYSGNDVIIGFEKVAGAGGYRVELQDVALGSWSSVESSGNTIFIFTHDTLGAMASVTVVGVTGLVSGDDWIIV